MAITMELIKLGENMANVVQRVRPSGMSGQLSYLAMKKGC